MVLVDVPCQHRGAEHHAQRHVHHLGEVKEIKLEAVGERGDASLVHWIPESVGTPVDRMKILDNSPEIVLRFEMPLIGIPRPPEQFVDAFHLPSQPCQVVGVE